MALALTNDNHGFYINEFHEPLSKQKFATAERRLKEKKDHLADVQNEIRLLELDAFNTYGKEVIYCFILPTMVDKARKWLEMINNKEFKLDKRKKCEERDTFNYLTHDLQKIFDQPDIKITEIKMLGYHRSADIIEFDCKGHHFILTIPIVQNVSLEDYQYNGAYAFQIHLHVEEKKCIHDFVGVTYDENELKDILNKWLDEHSVSAEVSKVDKYLPQEVD